MSFVASIRQSSTLRILICSEATNAQNSMAALDRHAVPYGGNRLVEPQRAVDGEELGRASRAIDEIVEDGAPSLAALTAHAFDREQHLLAVLAHAVTARSEMEVALRSSRTRSMVVRFRITQ
jgi:hypothetical protein